METPGYETGMTRFSLTFSNDSFEGEPEEKRRKTTNVVIDQPAAQPKVLIDNVPDTSSVLEEVKTKTCQQLAPSTMMCVFDSCFAASSSVKRVASGELL